ncbi:uncharacterized protein LOC127239374 [Andrographis paniculata]|uniref:uncharacterized protein LOC127239374 n=1 Tax=Andrographis paniculata TaxID=175694 RepID=UPI0021E7D4AD|nr:uncharacterized protein LOC127239374 [Andrographis paniculata]
MDDTEMAELFDGPSPSQVPSRPARFAPKGAKFKPKPEIPQSQPSASDSAELLSKPKKEEFGSKIDLKPEPGKGAVAMDVDRSPRIKAEKDKLMETEAAGTSMETEDEVVREIDVYFVPSVDPKTKLYILQYPLRPSWRPYELEERCDEVRMNPTTSEMEIHLSIDVDSKNYDSSADPRVKMEKQILTTKWKPHHTSGYAVGVLKENKLYINPIHAVVQLRPSMQHLDSKDSKWKSNVAEEGVVKSEEPQDGKPSRASKKPSNATEQAKDEGGDWVTLTYHATRTEMAQGYLHKLTSAESSQINFTMHPSEYLDSLCPRTTRDSSNSIGAASRRLQGLSLRERFKTWLLEGPPIHKFDALKYLAPDESDEEILVVLQEYARLVQGLWLPKSPLVYGTDQGIEVLARDYVLLLFSKGVIINNSQLPQRPQLSKAMKEVLKVLALERETLKDWKLKEPPDYDFVRKYPAVVSKQHEEWRNVEKKINDLYGGRNVPNTKTSSKTNSTNNLVASKSSSKVGVRTQAGAVSVTAMSEEAREAVTKALQKLFKSFKVCRFQQIGQLLRDMAVSERNTGLAKQAVAAANSIDTYPDEFKAIINQVAVNVHGICVPRSSPEHPEYDPFRKVVIGLFLAQGPNGKLKKATIVEAAKMELKREVTNNEYQKVLGELCSSQGGLWILNSGERKP